VGRCLSVRGAKQGGCLLIITSTSKPKTNASTRLAFLDLSILQIVTTLNQARAPDSSLSHPSIPAERRDWYRGVSPVVVTLAWSHVVPSMLLNWFGHALWGVACCDVGRAGR
jgi:hypothetical protein